jgi:hypothetical protein
MAYFDVDHTLILYHQPEDTEGLITIGTQRLLPHDNHIQEIKNFKASNWTVVVWSQGGGHWAAQVVTALGLKDYVDVCMTKPHIYYDDYPASEFLPIPIKRYLPSPKGKIPEWVR